MIRLTGARADVDLVFACFEGGQCAAGRLTDMGLVPGEKLRLLHEPGRGPVAVVIKGAKVALGHSLADKIFVEEE
ncbi:MAG: FeoA family protein [Candidatus Omnitrophica bacterium]|jgi:Fe2+ transport system protein FeoA|nr:FeoA family protein [Candidatus Omnitrophota bacterium]